jgi:hypothetical protein
VDLPVDLADGTVVFDQTSEFPLFSFLGKWYRASDNTDLDSLPFMDVFVIMGQSNADGKGQLSNLTLTPTVNLADTEMYFSTVDHATKDWIQGTWGTMNVGVNTSAASGRFGVEYGMAQGFYDLKSTYPDAFSTHPAFLKHAKGSTTLATDWDASFGNNYMYDSMEKAIADARFELAQKGYRLKIRGLVWFQGESDAFTESYADDYEDNLTAFIADVRTRLCDLDLPVVICQVAYASSPPTYLSEVRAAQQAVADNDLNVEIIDTDGLARRDTVHLNADSTFTLGEAVAAKLATMI